MDKRKTKKNNEVMVTNANYFIYLFICTCLNLLDFTSYLWCIFINELYKKNAFLHRKYNKNLKIEQQQYGVTTVLANERKKKAENINVNCIISCIICFAFFTNLVK